MQTSMDLLFSSLIFSSPVTILVSSRLLFSFFRWLQLRRVHAQTDGKEEEKEKQHRFSVSCCGQGAGSANFSIGRERGKRERELCD